MSLFFANELSFIWPLPHIHFFNWQCENIQNSFMWNKAYKIVVCKIKIKIIVSQHEYIYFNLISTESGVKIHEEIALDLILISNNESLFLFANRTTEKKFSATKMKPNLVLKVKYNFLLWFLKVTNSFIHLPMN